MHLDKIFEEIEYEFDWNTMVGSELQNGQEKRIFIANIKSSLLISAPNILR
jgi:hypothetical protein